MRTVTFALLLSLILTPAISLHAYTLKDVIEASPVIASSSPSQLCAPCSSKAIIIDAKVYELRLFTFEQLGRAQNDTPTFKDFITEWHLLEATPQQRAEALIPTDYFTATAQMKEKGFFFLLSLRQVTDPKLLTELDARSK